MNRYTIEMSAIEWDGIASDIASHYEDAGPASRKLARSVRMILSNILGDEDGLPYYVKEVRDAELHELPTQDPGH